MQQDSLESKKILITGASSGIGKQVALLCSQRDARVVLMGRDVKRLEEVSKQLEGSGHKYYSCDLEDLDRIETFLETVVAENGSFDGFVHCAGRGDLIPLKMLKPSKLERIMKINFCSFVELVRCLVKKKAYKEGMSVVTVSSISSSMGDVAKVAYSASKASLDAAVRCMARELADKGIRVNSVVPGWVSTGMFEKFVNENGETERMGQVIQRQYQGPSDPEDIAKTILFLLSDDSKVITGTSMDVSGGFLSSR